MPGGGGAVVVSVLAVVDIVVAVAVVGPEDAIATFTERQHATTSH